MAKKTFNLDNPAMQFISIPTEEPKKESNPKPIKTEPDIEIEKPVQNKPKSKPKNKPQENTEYPTHIEPKEGYKINPIYIEKKSKRLQLLVKPSLYEKLKIRAAKEESSVNDTLNRILEEAFK